MPTENSSEIDLAIRRLFELLAHSQQSTGTMYQNKTLKPLLGDMSEDEFGDFCHELSTMGFIRELHGPSSLPWRLTSRGKTALRDGISYVHLPAEAFKNRLRDELPMPKARVAWEYAGEARDAITCGLARAATVLAGASAEKAVIDLIEGYLSRDPTKKVKFENKRWIKERFTLLSNYLGDPSFWTHLCQDKGVSSEELEAIERSVKEKVLGVFDLFRIARNDQGHPTGIEQDLETARLRVASLPSFLVTAYRLTNVLAH